ncbi:MAG: NAD(P)/FAD-dependent oxidoreductase [Candidatus Glassbacteria bacterium]|nr:NAD(P)/FAD-dependent oxidoreductase [Candidatus Glassbacteria bacterium]
MAERTEDSMQVLVVGGGPAGCSCALSLVRGAARLGRRVRVALFEHKLFGMHYNQCLGVLSPPILQLLKDFLDLELPPHLVQREVHDYWLHTGRRSIRLADSSPDSEPSLVTRRVELDRYLLERASQAGVEVYQHLATDLEFTGGKVILYTEGGSFKGDIVVGAFGLGRRMGSALARRTGYRAPDFLETVVTKIHPGPLRVEDIAREIHAFLPSDPEIEFAALVPKGEHLTALVSGRNVTSEVLKRFLASPVPAGILRVPVEVRDVFKGNFPISPAGRFYGDNYITIGDSAGLIRPFKGKGINSAVLTGHYAARIILERGITAGALSRIEDDCRELIGDLWYGRSVRHLTKWLSRHSLFDPVLAAAERQPDLRQALFDSVSGQDTFRNIVHRLAGSPSTGLALAHSFFSHLCGLSSPGEQKHTR